MRRSRLRHKSRETIKTRLQGVPEYINVMGGRAKFVRTDVEDSLGRWSGSDLRTRDGYWVIHEGNRHHVYLLSDSGHAGHIAGGFFQKGCPQCASFIEKYEKRRPWRGKTSHL